MLQKILFFTGGIVFTIAFQVTIGSAQCKPDYTGSGYSPSSNCGDYLIPTPPVLGSDLFYSDARIFPTPPVFGSLYRHPGLPCSRQHFQAGISARFIYRHPPRTSAPAAVTTLRHKSGH
jgi:hypothetical protein